MDTVRDYSPCERIDAATDIYSDTCDRLLEVVSSENTLTILSCGQSLRTQTRHYPQRPGVKTGDVANNQQQLAVNTGVNTGVNTEVNLGDVDQSQPTVDTPSHYIKAYRSLGKTLCSPQAISGLVELADLYTAKAAKLPFFYRNNAIRITFLLIVLFAAECIPVAAILADSHPIVSDMIIIAILTPVALFVWGHLCWRHFPRCSGAKRIRQKLESIEPFIKLCEISNDELDTLFNEEDHEVFDYKVVGSAGDGFGFYLSLGSNRHFRESRSVLTQDIDLNIFINTITIKPENLLRQRAYEAEGFTRITFTEQETNKIADPVIRQCLIWSESIERYLLSAAAVSREMTKYFPSDDESTNTYIEEHFPALTLSVFTSGPNGDQEYEVDYAFALRYPEWPCEAGEWINRERRGLDMTTVQSIAGRGCYLVHKPCGVQQSNHNHDFDWRFTFASAEADLFHYHGDKKALKLAFVILKFLVKYETRPQGYWDMCFHNWSCLCEGDWEKEIPVLRTYHLKTIFLWMAEEETHLDYYTIKGNKTLKDVFMLMLHRYTKAMEERYLPNYFIRDRNMLSGPRYRDHHFRKAIKLLKGIRKRPYLSIQENFERQFINMKLMTGILIGIIVVNFIYGTIIFVMLRSGYDTTDYLQSYRIDPVINIPTPRIPDIYIPVYNPPTTTESPWWQL